MVPTLAKEALDLLKRLERTAGETEQVYLLRVDTVVSAHFDLWGRDLTSAIAARSLSQLIPIVVSCLEPRTQRDAIKACQNYLKVGHQRLDDREEGSQGMHDLMPVTLSNDEVTAFAEAGVTLGAVKFASPSDLYLLAEACSLNALWAHLMSILMGPNVRDTYTAMMQAPTDVFLMDPGDSDDCPLDDEAEDVLAVASGDRRQRRPALKHDAGGSGSKPRPLSEAALDQRVARVVNSGQRVTEQTGEKLDHFKEQLAKMLRDAEEQRKTSHDRHQEELAHQIRTIQQALTNLASAATDVKHQRPLQELAGGMASRARELERSAPYVPFQGSLSPSTPARPMGRSSAASPAITEVDSPPRGVAECSSSVMFSSAKKAVNRPRNGAPPPAPRCPA